jgi:hypothetical protein
MRGHDGTAAGPVAALHPGPYPPALMASWASITRPWQRPSPRWTLVALLVLQFALHARYLGLPPSGFHVWRQTQVLSIARNYHEESMNLFEPRVDSRGPWSGVTGLEFPLPYYLMALGYECFGFHHAIARLVMLLFSFVAILGAYALGRALSGRPGWGLAAAAMLILDPLFGYYSFVATPDVPMLGFLLLGFAALYRWSGTGRTRLLIAGSAALSLAALLKLSSAALWPAAAILLARGWRGDRARQLPRVLAAVAGGLLPVLAWYLWARHLSAVNHNHDFMLQSKLPYPIAIVPAVARKVLLQWLPEVYLSYPQFMLALVGVSTLRRRSGSPVAAPVAAAALGLLAYAVAVLPMLDMHDYFMTPVVVPLLLLALLGLGRMLELARTARAARWALAVLMIATAVVGPWRALTRFERSRPDADLLAMETRLPALIPDRHALVIAASDASPSIYLYFMHRKGWSVQESLGADSLRSLVAQGARYLVSDSRTLEADRGVEPRLRPVGEVGRFRVFRLAD